jgi:hypothetical protein
VSSARVVCSLRGLNLFSGLYGTTEVVPFPWIGCVALHGAEILRRRGPSSKDLGSSGWQRKGGAPCFEVNAGSLDFARDDRSLPGITDFGGVRCLLLECTFIGAKMGFCRNLVKPPGGVESS